MLHGSVFNYWAYFAIRCHALAGSGICFGKSIKIIVNGYLARLVNTSISFRHCTLAPFLCKHRLSANDRSMWRGYKGRLRVKLALKALLNVKAINCNRIWPAEGCQSTILLYNSFLYFSVVTSVTWHGWPHLIYIQKIALNTRWVLLDLSLRYRIRSV